jgi:hypothetical protein
VNRYPVASVFVLVSAQYVGGFVLFWMTFDLAYRFEGVDGWDRLYLLGGAPHLALAAAALPALICPPVAVVLLFTRFRTRAWAVAGGGLLVSLGVWLCAVSTFEQPSYLGG